MGRQVKIEPNIESLMRTLASKDGLARQRARKELVAVGQPAVPALIRALRESQVDQVRWEAAKALGFVRDPRAIPTLIRALEDKDRDVAWLAAEALHNFGKAAWPALLQALVQGGMRSAELRQGVHHIFWDQRQEGYDDLILALLRGLETETVPEMALTAAYDLIERLEAEEEERRAASSPPGGPSSRSSSGSGP